MMFIKLNCFEKRLYGYISLINVWYKPDYTQLYGWTEWRAADAAARARLAFPALWLAFSLCLLLKLGLNVRITHYGVFLAMPAFLSAVYLLLHLLPRAIGRRGFGPQNFRIAMLILLLAGFARVGIHSALFYRDKDFPVGAAGDRMLGYNPAVDPRGAELAAAADWINAHTSPTDTLAALPEGLMLNYLTRRANPTPYGVFMTEFWAFGQERMAGAYRLHPPDYIALIHRDSAEFGVPYFGTSERYGLKLMQWVNENYEPVHLIGGEPLRTGKFGIKILKARPRAKILQPD